MLVSILVFLCLHFQPPVNVSQIASQYQKALSQVATALASQTATQVSHHMYTYCILKGIQVHAHCMYNILDSIALS